MFIPSSLKKMEIETDKVIYRTGDRVMQIKNNYDIYWERNVGVDGSVRPNNKIEAGSGIFNGELGKITRNR